MKKTYLPIILVICTMIIQSCNHETEDLPKISLKIDTIINQLSDSTFFSDIRSLFYYNNKFFVSDYNRDQIFILDKDLRLIKTLGRKGNGPGEFSGVSHLYVRNDSIYAFNDYRRSIELYDTTGEYLKTIKPPSPIQLSSMERYFEYNNELYLTNANKNHSISKYNDLTGSVIDFGYIKQYKTPRETKMKNNRHLLKYQDYIIAVPVCQPTIEMYNKNGELIKQVDLGNIKPISNLIKYNDEQKLEENSFLVFFSDVCLYKNKLLITLLTIDENNERSKNSILEFEIGPEQIAPQRILILGDEWTSPICMSENYILTYTSRGQLIGYSYE